VEGLHERLGAVGDGRLRGGSVCGLHASSGIVTPAVVQELCILGHQDSASIVIEDMVSGASCAASSGVEGSGDLSGRGGDSRHDGRVCVYKSFNFFSFFFVESCV